MRGRELQTSRRSPDVSHLHAELYAAGNPTALAAADVAFTVSGDAEPTAGPLSLANDSLSLTFGVGAARVGLVEVVAVLPFSSIPPLSVPPCSLPPAAGSRASERRV